MKTHEDYVQRLPEFNVTAWDRSRQRLHAGAILFAACAIAAGAPVWAQDIAEAARQAQARKHQQTKHKKHVYTEEDLKRARILTLEDQELLAAKQRNAALPGAEALSTLDAQSLEHLPLGDVARMYRAMKQLNHSQTGELAEYHMPVASAVLASASVKFIAPKPNPVTPTPQSTPAAPVIPNPDVNVPTLNALLVSAKPNVPAQTLNRLTNFKSRSSARTVSATVKFAVSKPNMLLRSAHEAPVAPVLSYGDPSSMPDLTFAALGPTTGPAPTAAGFSNASASRSIIVKYGDSLWKLAQMILGDGHRWHELAANNPGIVNPNHILPGTPINIAGTTPVAPALPSEPRVAVRKGDSLWKIAQKRLGLGGFWGCIAKANPVIHDANRIYTGQVLAVPETCKTPSSK